MNKVNYYLYLSRYFKLWVYPGLLMFKPFRLIATLFKAGISPVSFLAIFVKSLQFIMPKDLIEYAIKEVAGLFKEENC